MPEQPFLRRVFVYVVILVGLTPMFYFSAVEFGIAEVSAQTDSGQAIVRGPADRYVENLAFGVGEKLTFEVNFGFINAGTATMEVADLIEFRQRPCYQIVTRANSNSFFSSIYKVEDRVESIIDAAGIFSWRFEKELHEGSYRSHRMYVFDQENHFVVYKDDTIPIEPYVHDALSPLYFLRTQPLEIGKSIMLDNFVDGQKLHLEIKVLKKERITVEAGTFDCILVEPVTADVGIFKNQGRLRVWLTDDRLRLPVLMKSKILVGSISAELIDFDLGELDEF